MSKQIWRPGNMLYPVPAVLVSVADSAGNDNLITIAWTGTCLLYTSKQKRSTLDSKPRNI